MSGGHLPNIEVVSPGLAEDSRGEFDTPNAVLDAYCQDNHSRRLRERIFRSGSVRSRLHTAAFTLRSGFGLNQTFDSTSSLPVSRQRRDREFKDRRSRFPGQVLEIGARCLSLCASVLTSPQRAIIRRLHKTSILVFILFLFSIWLTCSQEFQWLGSGCRGERQHDGRRRCSSGQLSDYSQSVGP